jgi:hypothetical protein
MGFFSKLCESCGHSLLSIYAANDINQWMTTVVAVLKNGSVIHGKYDGYGRIDDFDVIADHDATVWHRACWEVAGKPTDYRGNSTWADDQGYFFSDEHDVPDPRLGSVG